MFKYTTETRTCNEPMPPEPENTTRQSEIHRAMSALICVTERIASLESMLEERLETVTTPVESVSKPVLEPVFRTQLALDLEQLTDKLDTVAYRMTLLLDRIEL